MKLLAIFFLAVVLSACYSIKKTADLTIPPDPKEPIRAIVGEAAGEGYAGMLAVACAINNRPEGLQGVYGTNSPLYDTEPQNIIANAEMAYYTAKTKPKTCVALIQNADMWHSGPAPESWSHVPMIFIKKIGNHAFYRRITENST